MRGSPPSASNNPPPQHNQAPENNPLQGVQGASLNAERSSGPPGRLQVHVLATEPASEGAAKSLAAWPLFGNLRLTIANKKRILSAPKRARTFPEHARAIWNTRFGSR